MQVSFNVTLTALTCTNELINGTDLTVRVPGFGKFVVELSGVCDCNCTNNPVRSSKWLMYLFTIVINIKMGDSDFCNNGNGDLICGQCACDPGWYVCMSTSCNDVIIIFLGLVKVVNVIVVH